MWASIRLWLKVIIGFMFSVTLIMASLTYAIFGARSTDTIELIVTQATGIRTQIVVFSAILQPLVIHNVFWLCLAGLGFFLIFLYFIDHSYKVFLAPGVLCLVIAVFLNLVLFIMAGFIFDFTGSDAAIFVVTFFQRLRMATLFASILGVLLIVTYYWGVRLRKNPRKG
jgi:hypothetical protein